MRLCGSYIHTRLVRLANQEYTSCGRQVNRALLIGKVCLVQAGKPMASKPAAQSIHLSNSSCKIHPRVIVTVTNPTAGELRCYAPWQHARLGEGVPPVRVWAVVEREVALEVALGVALQSGAAPGSRHPVIAHHNHIFTQCHLLRTPHKRKNSTPHALQRWRRGLVPTARYAAALVVRSTCGYAFGIAINIARAYADCKVNVQGSKGLSAACARAWRNVFGSHDTCFTL